jgi:hypothetical protein
MPITSEHMATSGHIHLKKGTVQDRMELCLNYKKQFDRLEHDRLTTFFLHNDRQVDSCVGRITYASPKCGWMEDTPAHNTIVIDGSNSHMTHGQLIAFSSDAETPLAVVASNPRKTYYDNVEQVRGVAIIEDCWIVFDRVACQEARTIDRYQYGHGKATFTTNLTPSGILLPHLPVKGEFRDVVAGPCGRELVGAFQNDLRLRVVCDREMTAVRALTYGGYSANPMEVTFARVEKAKEVTFLAGFVLGKDKQPPELAIDKSTDDEILLAVTTTAKEYRVVVRPKAKEATIQTE